MAMEVVYLNVVVDEPGEHSSLRDRYLVIYN